METDWAMDGCGFEGRTVDQMGSQLGEMLPDFVEMLHQVKSSVKEQQHCWLALNDDDYGMNWAAQDWSFATCCVQSGPKKFVRPD